MGGVMTDDIDVLDCHLGSLQTSVGDMRPMHGVMASNICEALSIMGEASHLLGPDAAAVNIQTHLGSLVATLTAANQEATVVC
jgi:hypothetical protein